MRQQAKTELFIILAIATILELFLDAILGETIKQYLPIPHLTGLGVIILLLIVLAWRIEKMEMLLGGRGMGKNVNVKAFKFGKIGIYEVLALIAYVMAAIATFGLGSINLSFITDWAWLICIGSVIVMFGADKEKKKKFTLTGIEGLALIIAIALPLAAAGYLTAVGIDIGTYLADSTKSLVLFLVSVISAVVVATQD